MNWIDKKEIHCCNCKMNWNKYSEYDKHCCTCKNEWNYILEGKNHCCKCKMNYYDEELHCCNCKIKWNLCLEGKNHCCGCKMKWDNNESHCCDCKMKWDNNESHCCNCKMNWNKNENNHCCLCKFVYSREDLHYCFAKKITQNISKCTECDMGWNDTIEIHCCLCKNVWNKDLYYHCNNSKLCHVVEKNKHHCCICLLEECKCNIINDFINVLCGEFVYHIDRHLKPEYIANLYLNPCYNCSSKTKFIRGIAYLMKQVNKLSNLNTIKSQFLHCYHGTKNINSALNICCNSWDIKLRGIHGQNYGDGEYFSSDLISPKLYAGEYGKILISLCIKKFSNIYTLNNEKYIVVNNKKNISFCFPFIILDLNNNFSFGEFSCKHHLKNILDNKENIIEGIISNSFSFLEEKSYCYSSNLNYNFKKIIDLVKNNYLKFYCLDNNNNLIKYDYILTQKINSFLKNSNVYTFIHKLNNKDYEINLQNFTQKNTKTKKIRNIIFKYEGEIFHWFNDNK